MKTPSLMLIYVTLMACASYVGAFFPGSKSAPVHLGGGFKIENMDAFAMTVGAMVLSVIRYASARAPVRLSPGTRLSPCVLVTRQRVGAPRVWWTGAVLCGARADQINPRLLGGGRQCPQRAHTR
jgi:hypothetical protein